MNGRDELRESHFVSRPGTFVLKSLAFLSATLKIAPFMDSQSSPSMQMYDFLEWFEVNRQKIIVGGAGLLVIIAAVGFWTHQSRQKQIDAYQELLKLPPVINGMGGPMVATPEPYQQFAQQHPGTEAGVHAELLAAGLFFDIDDTAAAEKGFAAFIQNHPDSPLVADAQLGTAATLDATGKSAEAIAKYKQIISQYSGTTIVPQSKLALGRLSEASNNFKEAFDQYKDVARTVGNPYDPWVQEAQERMATLLSVHPELEVPAVSAPPASKVTITPVPAATPTSPVAPAKSSTNK